MSPATYPANFANLLMKEMSDERSCIVDPLVTDSFIARSAMQKAIRRADCRTALRAAATLMELDPDVIWKRLLVTAMEDIGVGEFALLAKIVIAQGKRARRAIGNDWPIAVALIRQACRATKCQAANDLHNIAINDPKLEPFRINLSRLPKDALMAVAGDGSLDIARRYAAALRVLEDERLSAFDADRLFDRIGASRPAYDAFYREAFRKSRLGLAASSLILLDSDEGDEGDEGDDAFGNDDLTPEIWIGGVPAYALDQYTRGGRRALQQFVADNAAWRSFARHYQLTHSTQLKAAGELVFRAEGALLNRRRAWIIGRTLYARSSTIGCFIPPCAVPVGLALIREQLPALNEIRRDILADR